MDNLEQNKDWCHYSGMPSPSAYVESDKRLELYNVWKHRDSEDGISFYGWLRVILCNASVWSEVSVGGQFRRSDALDIMLDHSSGKINCNGSYPWKSVE